VIDEKIKKRADKARTRPNPCLVHQKANTKCGFRVSLNCVCVCTTKQTAQSSHRLPFRLLCRQHTEHSQRLGSITITLIIKRPNQRAIATAIRPYRRSIRVCLLPSHTFHCVSKNSWATNRVVVACGACLSCRLTASGRCQPLRPPGVAEPM